MDGNLKAIMHHFNNFVIYLYVTDTFIGPEQHIFIQSSWNKFESSNYNWTLHSYINIKQKHTRLYLCFKLGFKLGNLNDKSSLNNDRDGNPTMFL